MKRDDILNVIAELSASQGFYGRLYRALIEMRDGSPEVYNEYMEQLEAEKFGDALDLILYLEC